MSTAKLEELAIEALARDGSRDSVEFKGKWYSWGELRHVAERVQQLIAESGADARAPVAFAPRNRPSAAGALMGLVAQGRTIRMIYAFQSPAGIARDVTRLKPAVFVAAAEDISDDVRETLAAEGVAAIALTETDAAAVAGLEKTRRPSDPDAPLRPQIEILTSGTTGPPKQFPIGYDMIARQMIGLTTIAGRQQMGDPAEATPMLLYMPFGNISGVYTTLPPFLRGQRVTLLERFSVGEWHEHLLKYRPTISGLPPAGVQMVLDAGIPREDLASVKALGTGAAPLDPTVHRAFEEHYGIPILLSYGATEFAGPVSAMTIELHAEWGDRKFGSVGRAMAGAQLRVVDPDTGEALAPGEEGILEVISPRIGPDWIRTSDVAVLDADGFLFHRGRADGAIMRGGFKLLPETIERALLLHPAVSAAGVLGVADKRLGQVPAAVVQFKPGFEQTTIADLEAHLRNHVFATHIPTIWHIVDDLPKTPSFKVDRPALKRLVDSVREPAAIPG